jgi:hypothetical protein
MVDPPISAEPLPLVPQPHRPRPARRNARAHVLDRDLLRALAAMAIERVEQHCESARELAGLVQVFMPQAGRVGEHLARDHSFGGVDALRWFGGNFRNDIDAFIRREIVEAVVVPGRFELGPITQGQGCNSYYGFVDPSGGGADSFTLGIAHLEGNMAILDLVREAKPPFSPSDIVGEFAETLRQYGLHRVTGDRYSGEFVRELFSERGVSYEVSERSKSEIYIDLLPLLIAAGLNYSIIQN